MRRALWALAAIGGGLTLAGASGAGNVAPSAVARAALTGTPFESATLPWAPDALGAGLALSGDGRTAVVGFPATDTGTVGVYTRSGAAWRRVALLKPPARSGARRFGASVAVGAGGRYVIVGAPGTNGGKGAAWAYRLAGGGIWVGSRLPVSGGSGKSRIGAAVGLSGDGSRAIIGGPDDGDKKGAVWFFRRSGTSWLKTGGKVTAGDAVGKSAFGTSIAMGFEGDAVAIGGPGDSRERGAVWMFRRTGSAWKRQATIRESSLASTRRFGSDVGISADGYRAVTRTSTSAWLLTRTGSKWRLTVLTGSVPPNEFLEQRRAKNVLGVAMAPDGLTTVVCSSISKGSAGLVVGGLTWVFTRSGGPVAPIEGDSTVGAAVALSYNADVMAIASKTVARVYTPTPVATRVAPAAGPTAGGTEVTVTGVNFRNVRGVTFGANAAASFTVTSPTVLRAVSPPAAAGTVHVSVRTPFGASPAKTPGLFGGPSTRFTYVGPPIVTGLEPSSGPPTGGTQVTVRGTGLSGATAVRFGSNAATSFTVASDTEVRAVSPGGAAGSVAVTVTTPYGSSPPDSASQFTYVTPGTVVSFDNITTGGPGQALVAVTNQYAAQGVSFNSPTAIDYSKGSAIPGFARSGTVAIEQCVGVELCTTPIRGTFSAPKSIVRVWVGFSFQLNQPLQVQLRALNGSGGVLGTASTTLPARTTPTPVTIPLEVRPGGATIAQFEVLVPGGVNNALAVDDVTFEG